LIGVAQKSRFGTVRTHVDTEADIDRMTGDYLRAFDIPLER